MKSTNSVDRIIQVSSSIKIGENIKKLRLDKGYKQTEFVIKLQLIGIDMSIYSLNRIEKGTQNPTTDFLYACCELLSCDMNTIFNFNEM